MTCSSRFISALSILYKCERKSHADEYPLYTPAEETITMGKSSKNTAVAVKSLIEPLIKELGYSLWDVEYIKEGTEWRLRVTIDNTAKITINDCEKVHNAIEPILDEADLIENSYRLAVSSPGIERKIATPQHYIACLGDDIELKLYSSVDGKKQLVGKLTSFDEKSDIITLTQADGQEYNIKRTAVARANVYYDFG